MSEFEIFAGESVRVELQKRMDKVRKIIEAEDRLVLLAADVETYLSDVLSPLQLRAPKFRFDEVTAGTGKAKRIVFQPSYSMVYRSDVSEAADGFVFRIPFTGDPVLLRRSPTQSVRGFDVHVETEEATDGRVVRYAVLHNGADESRIRTAFSQAQQMISTNASGPRHTDVILFKEARARFTFSRMSEALAVQTNGFGSLLWASKYA